MARIDADTAQRGLPTVVMAHAFVTGAVPSDSERDITAGGVSGVHPSVFAGATYAALGHLHRPQQPAEEMRYSGSPVAMSFSEAGHTKSSLVVTVDGGSVTSVEAVAAPLDRPLAVVRGTLEDLLADPRHTAAESAWVRAVLTDPIRPAGAMERLRRRFPHCVDLGFEPLGARSTCGRTPPGCGSPVRRSTSAATSWPTSGSARWPTTPSAAC